MTAPPSFPSLAGQGWSITKKPTFHTLIAAHASGREVRDALYQNPIWDFELVFEALDSTPTGSYGAAGPQSLQSLMGLFLSCQGQLSTFLYTDPTDCSVGAQPIGTGDGATLTFAMVRSMGAFSEPVGWVTNVSQLTINGAPLSSGWSIIAPNTLVFAAAPASGAAIAASFTYAFQCRFAEDVVVFEQFMSGLWKADSVKFRSVRDF